MSWQLIICLAFLYQYGMVQIVIKKIGVAEGSRTRKLVWQYFFAASLALITAVISGQINLSRSFIIVAIIGAANAFACYCHWRAYDISMSRTAVLSNLDDLTAMGLGYMILGEARILTPYLAAGIVLSIISTIIFARAKHRNKPSDGRFKDRLVIWVLGYTIVWGIAMFSMRFFSVRGMDMPTYVVAWYGGAWVGALLTRFMMGRDEAGLPLAHSQKAKVLFLALCIWTSLMLGVFIRKFTPITIIQPIQLVAEMSIPAIIGLTIFGEAHGMSRREIAAITIGIVGITLILIFF